MAVRSILRMGNPRLLEPAAPVSAFATPELRALVADLYDTMRAAGGAGLAAPQIGVGLQVVVFGFASSPRYPDAEPVPQTVLVNSQITALDDETDEAWEGCLSVPGLRAASCRASAASATLASTPRAWRSIARSAASMLASSSMSAITCRVCSTRCGCATLPALVLPTSYFRASSELPTRSIRPRLFAYGAVQQSC